MRLIDAEEFKKQIAGMAIANNYPADKANKMCELIDCQPTAYDVDKVVEQLEKAKYEDDLYPCNLAVEIEEAKSIVKSGGIE